MFVSSSAKRARFLCIFAFAMPACHRQQATHPTHVLSTNPTTMVVPVGIILHDSDTPSSIGGVVMNAAEMERIHAIDHPNWATLYQGKTYHIAYHFIILPNGKVEVGRPVGCVGTHARHFNDWVGICMIGGFSSHRHWYPETPTRAQLKSLYKLCGELMAKYHIPLDHVKRHRDVNLTYCPGDRFPYQRILKHLGKLSASPHQFSQSSGM